MSESDSEQEINPDIQNDILQRLQQFGDSLLDEEDYQKRTKKVRRKKEKLRQKSLKVLEENEKDVENETISEKKNKKKKSKKDKEKPKNGKSDEEEVDSVRGENKNILKFKKDLGLLDFKLDSEGNDSDDTVVKSSNCDSDSKKRKAPEVIVFDDPAKKKKKELYTKTLSKNAKKIEKDATESQDLFDMKSARFEVQKFGIKGMETTKKELAQTALAMKLGAKANKRKYMNYRELMEMKKSEKTDAEERRELDRQMGYRVSSSGSKKTKKTGKDKNDVGFLDGQIGKYKGGVQMLSKNDFLNAKKDRKFKKSR